MDLIKTNMEALGNTYVRAFWYSSNNIGDNLNHFIIKSISDKEPIYIQDRTQQHYICCGSILAEANSNSIVWGAGFGADYERINYGTPIIHSVRGKLSREILKLDIPVGDPALLMPLFYKPEIEKKHKVAFIPHWSNLEKALVENSIKIISPLLPVKEFINEILSCETIYSESLHGLILCDAYKVPNCWTNLNSMDEFKFKDYYSTTDNEFVSPYDNKFRVNDYNYDLIDLYNSCPFKNKPLLEHE